MPGRRLDPASVFERLVATYGAQFTLIFPAAVLVFLPVAVLSAIIGRSGFGAGLLLQLLSSVATYWLQGMTVQAVRDIQDGRRDFTVGGLFASVVPVLASLVLAGIVASIGITIGLVLLIVPGLVLLTFWAVIAPVIVIERVPALRSLARSQELVSGNGWPVFGVIAAVFLLQILGSVLLGAVFQAADSRVGAGITALVSGALLAPISAIAAALVYLDLSGARPAAGTPADRPAAPGPASASASAPSPSEDAPGAPR